MSAIMQIKDLSMRDAVTQGFRIRRGASIAFKKQGYYRTTLKVVLMLLVTLSPFRFGCNAIFTAICYVVTKKERASRRYATPTVYPFFSSTLSGPRLV